LFFYFILLEKLQLESFVFADLSRTHKRSLHAVTELNNINKPQKTKCWVYCLVYAHPDPHRLKLEKHLKHHFGFSY